MRTSPHLILSSCFLLFFAAFAQAQYPRMSADPAAVADPIPYLPPTTSQYIESDLASGDMIGQSGTAVSSNVQDGVALTNYADDPLMEPGAGAFDPLDPKVQAAFQKFAWKKGDFTFEPYGYVQVNTIYETAASYRGDYIMWVLRQPPNGNRNQFYLDAKSTRLGFNVLGPDITCLHCEQYKTAATVEIDFQGQFQYYHKPGVQFRRAFIEMKNDYWRFLGGMEWDVISPLNPNTFNWAVGFAVGNLDYRRPQLRVERKFYHSCTLLTLAQLSINQAVPVDGDVSTTDTVLDYASPWPMLEGRLAWTIGYREGPGALPWTIGVSAHVGEENYDFLTPGLVNVGRRTWSANTDIYIPLTERLAFRSEVFTGENLSSFWGGIAQGVNPITGDVIRSNGGWIELEYKWCPGKWRSYIGYMIDDPLDADLAPGQRCYNQEYYGNLIYNFNKNFEVGAEVSQWKTSYILADPTVELTRLEFLMRYKF